MSTTTKKKTPEQITKERSDRRQELATERAEKGNYLRDLVVQAFADDQHPIRLAFFRMKGAEAEERAFLIELNRELAQTARNAVEARDDAARRFDAEREVTPTLRAALAPLLTLANNVRVAGSLEDVRAMANAVDGLKKLTGIGVEHLDQPDDDYDSTEGDPLG